jgi:hypothetical protein
VKDRHKHTRGEGANTPEERERKWLEVQKYLGDLCFVAPEVFRPARTYSTESARSGHLFPDDLDRIADAFDAAAENAADWLRTGPSLRAVPSDGDRL